MQQIGSTILEVLIALLFLSVALLGLFELQLNSQRDLNKTISVLETIKNKNSAYEQTV